MEKRAWNLSILGYTLDLRKSYGSGYGTGAYLDTSAARWRAPQTAHVPNPESPIETRKSGAGGACAAAEPLGGLPAHSGLPVPFLCRVFTLMFGIPRFYAPCDLAVELWICLSANSETVGF